MKHLRTLQKMTVTFALPLMLSGCLGGAGFGDQSSVTETPDDTLAPSLPIPNNPSEKISAVSTDILAQVGNRKFVESVLKNVFLSSSASVDVKTKFRTVLDGSVQKFPGEFGGPLVLYSTQGLREMKDTTVTCGNSTCSNDELLDAPYWAPSTPARSAAVSSACLGLLDSTAAPVSDAFLITAVQNLGADLAVEPSADLVKLIPQLFSPGYETPTALNSASMAIISALKAKNLSAKEQWRGVFQVHCQNPYWQFL